MFVMKNIIKAGYMKKFDLSKIAVKSIFDVRGYTLQRFTSGEGTMSHSALVIRRSGKTVYTVNGIELVADSNNIVFLPAGISYSMEVEEKGACVVIEFDIDHSEETPEAGEYFFNNAKDIIATAKNILHYWTLRGPAFEAKCFSEFYAIITQISTLDSYTHTLAGKYRMIHRSVKYIEENYQNPDLYTTELAEMSEIGETYYRNIFISVFNMAPAKYIQLYRIGKAKELLVSTTRSIEEIAIAVGFANSSYFCKVFKSLTGLTPLEFSEKGKLLG